MTEDRPSDFTDFTDFRLFNMTNSSNRSLINFYLGATDEGSKWKIYEKYPHKP